MEGDKKYITGEELKQHNKEGDLWISIQGKVYNVSDWAHEHPGGDVPLLNLAGQDVTDAFIAYHPGTAWQYLDKFFTGYYLKDFKVSETSKDYRRLASEFAKLGLFEKRTYYHVCPRIYCIDVLRCSLWCFVLPECLGSFRICFGVGFSLDSKCLYWS